MLKKQVKMLRWKWIKFRYSISYICIILIVCSAALFALSYCLFEKASILYEMSFALFTGVIASTIVTLIVTIKQEKDTVARKKAILFDIGFILTLYSDDYQKFIDNPPEAFDEKIKQLYFICEEPAENIIKLYKSNPVLFDETEITFIRKINSSYSFFNILMECELTDETIKEYFSKGLSKDSEGMRTYWKLVNEVGEGLIYLMIKWKHDKLI